MRQTLFALANVFEERRTDDQDKAQWMRRAAGAAYAAGAASAAITAYALQTGDRQRATPRLGPRRHTHLLHPPPPPCRPHPTEPPHASPPESHAYFDQYDDDLPPPDNGEFPYNTRTYWRPGARAALKIVSAFATMHIYTAAQASYCAQVQRRLEADGLHFASTTHRESHSQHDMMREGKDLRLALHEGSLKRALFFRRSRRKFRPAALQRRAMSEHSTRPRAAGSTMSRWRDSSALHCWPSSRLWTTCVGCCGASGPLSRRVALNLVKT